VGRVGLEEAEGEMTGLVVRPDASRRQTAGIVGYHEAVAGRYGASVRDITELMNLDSIAASREGQPRARRASGVHPLGDEHGRACRRGRKHAWGLLAHPQGDRGSQGVVVVGGEHLRGPDRDGPWFFDPYVLDVKRLAGAGRGAVLVLAVERRHHQAVP